MKKLIVIALLATMLFSVTDAFAGYTSRSSYVSRSTTFSRPSYSRSYSAPTPRSYAPSYRSAPSAPRNTTTIINRNTTVHSGSSGGGIAGNPFFWMWAMGNHGNQQPQTVIVQPQQVQPGVVGPVQAAPAPVVEQVAAAPVEEDNGIGPFGVFMLMIAAVAVGGILYARSHKEGV